MIILVCGQPKSASSYLAAVARAACNVAGHNQKELTRTYLADCPEMKGSFWAGPLGRLFDVAQAMPAEDVLVVKTHAPPPKGAAKAIAAGQVLPMMSVRHPGDAALSCYEAGEKARAPDGPTQPAFAALLSHRDAIDFMAQSIERTVMPWFDLPGVWAVGYDELTSDPTRMIARLAMALSLDPAGVESGAPVQNLLAGRTRVYNFGVGTAGRHATHFSPEDQEYLQQSCGPFIAFCKEYEGLALM